MINRFYQLVKQLQGTNGRIEKENFLRAYEGDEDVKKVLHFLFNPYIVSGISDKKLNKFRKEVALPLLDDQCGGGLGILELIEYFTKNNTGTDNDVRVLVRSARYIADGDAEIEELVYGVIKKDLKLGIQSVTLNKVFGENFIPRFELMLAETYADNIGYVEGKRFIVTEKLDGVRCVLIFGDNGLPNFFSRQGRVISKLVELESVVMSLDKDFVYDGELLLDSDENLASKDLYRETVKVTSSDNEKRKIIFNMFDKLPKADFQRGVSEVPCEERKASLEQEIEKLRREGEVYNILRYVEPLYIGEDMSKIDEFLDIAVEREQEGVMVNIAAAPYECKRTKGLLKVKKFNTADVLVEKLEEGTGRNKGKLGAVWIVFIGPDGKRHTCKVGSGFKDDEREYYWANQDEILGKIIEIGYFEISRNQQDENYSLRFPTFKHVRGDKSEISMY